MEDNAAVASETPSVEPQNTEPQFYERYGDDSVKEFFEKNNIKDEASLGKWAVNANSMIGKKGILPPGEEATDEQRQEFKDAVYKHLGVPENGEYEFELPEGTPEEIIDSESGQEFRNQLADVALKNGMSPQGFQELMNTIYTAYGQEVAAMNAKVTELQDKLGENGKMNDAGDNRNVSKESMQNEYKDLIRQYVDLKKANKHQEAQEAYNKYTAMRKYIDG